MTVSTRWYIGHGDQLSTLTNVIFPRMSAVNNQLTARCFQIVPNFRMFGSTTFCLSVVLFGNAGLLCQQTTRWYRWRSRTCFFYDQNVKNVFLLGMTVKRKLTEINSPW